MPNAPTPQPPTPYSLLPTPSPITIATDARSRAPITLDLSRPRAILATGKRGSGKTTTLHTLARRLADQGATVIAIDPLGALCALSPAAIPLLPGDTLKLNPSDLSTDAWLALFDLSLSKPGGIALSRAIRNATRQATRQASPQPVVSVAEPSPYSLLPTPYPYTIPDLIRLIQSDERAKEGTIEALTNRLEAAQAWSIFHTSYHDLAETFTPGLHLINLAALDPGPRSLRNLVVSLLISRLFARAQSTPYSLLPTSSPPTPYSLLPTSPSLLLLDEAHNFTASGALAAKPLTRWAREGRNFGLSIALATQRPATLPADIISQADILIIHHLTLLDDLKAVGRLASTYARNLPAILKGIREPGQAVIIDDATERAVVGHIISTP